MLHIFWMSMRRWGYVMSLPVAGLCTWTLALGQVYVGQYDFRVSLSSFRQDRKVTRNSYASVKSNSWTHQHLFARHKNTYLNGSLLKRSAWILPGVSSEIFDLKLPTNQTCLVSLTGFRDLGNTWYTNTDLQCLLFTVQQSTDPLQCWSLGIFSGLDSKTGHNFLKISYIL